MCFLFLIIVVAGMEIAAQKSKYHVASLEHPVEINAEWDKDPWENIESLDVDKRVGNKTGYKPEVKAKVGYTQKAIHVIFKVTSKYVRCKWDTYQDPVYQDSCVEFFFTPGTDLSRGYFNLEINCAGTALFSFQNTKKQTIVSIPKSKFNKINIAHSLPRTSSEIKDRITWTIEYSIPISILSQYTTVKDPASGAKWRANFYSTASESTHPHWLSWSSVRVKEPDFHRPEFFGILEF